jgi:hypothetical protein
MHAPLTQKIIGYRMSASLPKSASHWLVPIISMLLAVGVYYVFYKTDLSNLDLALIVCFAMLVFQGGFELLAKPWCDIPRPKLPLRDVINSSCVKFIGTMAGLCTVLYVYWQFQEYRRANYAPFFEVLPYALLMIPFVVGLCIFYTEWRLGPSKHHGEDFGLVILGRWKEVSWPALRDDLLGWVIKGFFFIINFTEVPRAIGNFRGREDLLLRLPFPQAHAITMDAIYYVIIAVIVPGYLFSSRLFGTHIRKIDSSWFGYVATFCCYAPFVSGVFGRWLNYHPTPATPAWNEPWVIHFGDFTILLYIIGGLIIFFELMHCWAEAAFGIRSSNLANRGIITNGLFRICKHPVYTAKCINWFLIWLPILQGRDALDCIRLTIAWALVCGIYMMRAWAEEKVLAEDPDYVTYALWADEHGMFAFAGKICPPLTFRWRLKRWIAKGDMSASLFPN